MGISVVGVSAPHRERARTNDLQAETPIDLALGSNRRSGGRSRGTMASWGGDDDSARYRMSRFVHHEAGELCLLFRDDDIDGTFRLVFSEVYGERWPGGGVERSRRIRAQRHLPLLKGTQPIHTLRIGHHVERPVGSGGVVLM